MSLLLNGGGITQLRDQIREMNEALTGNEVKIKEFLNHIDHLVSDLDSHRHDITAALDAPDRLSATLAEREDDVKNALNDLTPGLAELRDQRKQLLTMLTSLDELPTSP